MSSSQINIKLQPHESERNFNELVELCNQNQIQVNTVHEEIGVIKHCALDFLITIILTPEFWVNISNSIISNLFYESFKGCIAKITKRTKSSNYFNSMKITSHGVEFIVENENLSDEIISKGLETFKEIALSNSNKELSWEEMMLNKTIVFPNQETGEIEVSNELDFVRKHIARINAKEETPNE